MIYGTRMLDKKYLFYKHTSPNEVVNVYKEENELSSKDKELMLSTIIHEFNKLPEDVKIGFISQIVDQYNIKYQEEKLSVFSKYIEEMLENEGEAINS